MAGTIQVRLGAKQKKRLEAMAASQNMSQTQFLNVLVDIAARTKGFEISQNINLIVDSEFERRVNQFPVLKPEGVL